MATDNPQGWKIFIGGIASTTTQDMIQKYFEQYGELTDCVLMHDKTTGKSRGFGFVTYKDPKKVDFVLGQTHNIDGKTVDCKRAIPRDQQGEPLTEDLSNIKTKKLFVGGLPQNLTLQVFNEYFEQFGKIEDSVIMMDKDTGKSRGFGFVTYADEASVDKIIEKYVENKIDGKWVECKKALPRDRDRDRERDRDRDRDTTSHKKQDNRNDRHSRNHSRGRRDRDRSDRDSRSRDHRDSYYDEDYHSPQPRQKWNQQDNRNGGGYNDYANYQRYPTMQENYGYLVSQDQFALISQKGYYGTGYMQSPVPMQNNYDPYGMMNPQYANPAYKNQGYSMMGYDPNMNQMQMGMPNMQMGPGNTQGMNQGIQTTMPQNMTGTTNPIQPTQNMGQSNLTQTQNQSQQPIQQGQMPQNIQPSTQIPSNMQGNAMMNQNLQPHYGNSPPQNMAANGTNIMGSMPMQNQIPNQYYGSNTTEYSYQNSNYSNQQRGSSSLPTTNQPYQAPYNMNDRSAGPIKSKSGKTREDRYYKPYP